MATSSGLELIWIVPWREVGIDRGDFDAEADLAGVGTAGGVGRRGADALRLQKLRWRRARRIP